MLMHLHVKTCKRAETLHSCECCVLQNPFHFGTVAPGLLNPYGRPRLNLPSKDRSQYLWLARNLGILL